MFLFLTLCLELVHFLSLLFVLSHVILSSYFLAHHVCYRIQQPTFNSIFMQNLTRTDSYYPTLLLNQQHNSLSHIYVNNKCVILVCFPRAFFFFFFFAEFSSSREAHYDRRIHWSPESASMKEREKERSVSSITRIWKSNLSHLFILTRGGVLMDFHNIGIKILCFPHIWI